MESEWKKFQKMLEVEEQAADEAKDQDHEELAKEKQVERVEGELQAWSEVEKMEKKWDSIKKQIEEGRKANVDVDMEEKADVGDIDSEEEDEEMFETFQWRKKRFFM